MSEGSFPFSAAVSGAYYAICMRSVGVASHGLRCLDTTYAGFSPLLLLMRVLSLLLFLPPRPFLAHTMPSAYAAWGSHPTGFAALTLHMQGSSPPLLLSRVFSPVLVFFSLIFEVNCFELPPYPRWVAALRIVTDRHRRRRPCASSCGRFSPTASRHARLPLSRRARTRRARSSRTRSSRRAWRSPPPRNSSSCRAMVHQGGRASHGARPLPLGPQPWHRETTRAPRAAVPRQRQGIVISHSVVSNGIQW